MTNTDMIERSTRVFNTVSRVEAMKGGYIGLDAVRFAAAAMVTLFHLSYYSWHAATNQKNAYIEQSLGHIGALFTSGYVGVPIFFVLSGFVIAFSAHEKDSIGFLKSRMLRLYPAAWLCATITLSVIIGTSDWEIKYVNSISLNPLGPWVDGVYWTLAVELQFYAIVFLLLFLSGSRKIVQLGCLLGAISSAFWIGRVIDFATGKYFSDLFSTGEEVGGLLTNGCYFSLGIMMWSFTVAGYGKRRVLISLVCIISGLTATTASARYQHLQQGGPAHDMVIVPLVWLIAVCCIAASAHWNDQIYTRFRHWRKRMRLIGLATYPLYLVHQVFGQEIMRHTVDYVGPQISFWGTLILVLLIAWAIIYIERIPRMFLAWIFDTFPLGISGRLSFVFLRRS
jgi:peptidoglycan/LPS O-acetylase OafA/YrhL